MLSFCGDPQGSNVLSSLLENRNVRLKPSLSHHCHRYPSHFPLDTRCVTTPLLLLLKKKMRTARLIATTRRNLMGRRIPSSTSQFNKEAIKLETKALRWNSTTVAKALCTKIDSLTSNPTAMLPFSCEITFEEDDDGT